jgi:hypothetical protein
MVAMRASSNGGTHLHLGAIVAAALLTAGTWLLLHTLGLAAGLIVPDRGDPESLRGVGLGSGAWSVAAPLLALFAGGTLVARLTGLTDRKASALHGVLVWALTVVPGALVVMAAVAALIGDARPVRGTIAAASGNDPVGALGFDLGAILVPTNARLAERGSPPVTVPQIHVAITDLVPPPAPERGLDRMALVDRLVAAVHLPVSEAEQIAGQIERQVAHGPSLARSGFASTGRASWGAFFTMIVGLISAAAGASSGSARLRRALARPPKQVLPVAAPVPARS